MAKIYFETLGCRLNRAETERMAQGFVLAGHQVVDQAQAADLLVVNTCSVTRTAAAKSRKAARRAHGGQRVVVTGCHADVRPREFADADLVVRNADKDELQAIVQEKFGMEGLALGMDYTPAGRPALYPLVLDRTRAFVKVQDGCNLRCTFCMTTIARGASRSRPADAVVAEIRALNEKGCQEAVLTGVHAGAYLDPPDVDLGALVERVLTETELPRLRLSSLEPWNFKPHWIELWRRFPGRMCRHVHMSLQSGSDTVLRRMARMYDTEGYAEKVQMLRRAVPELALTTDLIVGFPGETEKEHRASLDFVRGMAFAGAHVFPFSARPGTVAAEMPGQLPHQVKSLRAKEMREVTQGLAAAFRRSMRGRELEVLWEREVESGVLEGLSDHYLRVRAAGEPDALNTVTSVRIIKHDTRALQGVRSAGASGPGACKNGSDSATHEQAR